MLLLRHYLQQGLSKAEIARSLGVSRLTIVSVPPSTGSGLSGAVAGERIRLPRSRQRIREAEARRPDRSWWRPGEVGAMRRSFASGS